MQEDKKDISADIRNKLQVAITVLESLEQEKKIPKHLVEKGICDLKEVLNILDNF